MSVRDRLTRFVAETLREAAIVHTAPVAMTAWPVPGEPVPFAVARAQDFAAFSVGDRWGRAWSTLWVQVHGDVPPDWVRDAHRRVELVVDLGFHDLAPGFQAEALAFRPDGTVIKGISPRNAWLPVDGDHLDAYLELAANPTIPPESHWRPTALGAPSAPDAPPLYRLERMELALIDARAEDLLRDIDVLAGLAEQLPPGTPRAARIWQALDRMLDAIDPDDLFGSIESAHAVLAPALAAPAAASAHTIVATGHAHIDSAWLWPVRETIRKCARTFSNVLDLLERHPDLRFSCSSAQQLAWVEEHYPDLFARIRDQVRAGRFVLVGGQWVEPDTNLPGGEATARQLIVGKLWFLEKFGVETTEVWLPDTFGYSAALPQIVRLSGSDWFMTQKISWNQTNRMPHHSFWWEGIDGTRVFTHFPPIETYNAELSPAELAHAERTFLDHGTGTVSLAPFGWGDGGGGPTREMVASAHRQADLEGSPRVVLGTPRDFYERAASENPALPVWSGEMYLELHRGTLTSQLRTKQGNRRVERMLHEAELWATTAAVRAELPYPLEALQRAWQRTLLLQFHDILPGSSIAWVHREAEADHARLQGELDEIVRTSIAALTGHGDLALTANSAPLGIAGVPAGAIDAPAAIGAPVTLVPAGDDGWILDNGLVRAEVDGDGLLRSLRDASGREAIAPGARAGRLLVHPDHPDKWDAWDIDRHYRARAVDLGHADEVTAEVVSEVAQIRATRSTGASTIVQTVSLRPGSGAVDVTLHVDWQERHRLLRMYVPLDVHADRSSAEIQFGHLERPTHSNTSWDAARFEIVAQRWIHVGEPGYGVAIANDSTYGHSVERETRPDGGTTTTVGLSVLRAPTFPDPDADRGTHDIAFAIRPGAGLREAAEEGHRLDGGVRRVRGAQAVAPLIRSTDPDVRVETVKLAEDGSGDVIVRLYEASGGRRTTALHIDVPGARVHEVDLLERTIVGGRQFASGDGIILTLRPFEILTLRCARRATHLPSP
ncbi:glycosyl hydrolase-related protein [Microbacterium sp. cx-55]|uniref:alpha-mannosidase n=1 Tax=Microbacterium sp. cx-55 TaxID=2875948 RepID=UPI001CC14DB0|nr:glycoside hydrolase family 38 C-terminal domain-containing protein [Microbacterium sp. cx-55]UGB35506.1 glycosyl hydrolase-related protein [Microbacterium sp. cx-55]